MKSKKKPRRRAKKAPKTRKSQKTAGKTASEKTKVLLFEEVTGHWLFLIGIIVALSMGILAPSSLRVGSLLVTIGIIVGLFNVKAKEINTFMLATIALAIAARSFELLPFVGESVLNIMTYILSLVAPAAGVVALVVIWKLAVQR